MALQTVAGDCTHDTGFQSIHLSRGPRSLASQFAWRLEDFRNVSAQRRVSTIRFGGSSTHTWSLLKISAMCSFNHSTSLRAEKMNSSASFCAKSTTQDRSSEIHGPEPTGNRVLPLAVAMSLSRLVLTILDQCVECPGCRSPHISMLLILHYAQHAGRSWLVMLQMTIVEV